MRDSGVGTDILGEEKMKGGGKQPIPQILVMGKGNHQLIDHLAGMNRGRTFIIEISR